jgi:DUF2934 family protein
MNAARVSGSKPNSHTHPDTESSTSDLVAHEEIARLAYALWESRGCQAGSPEEDWFSAEEELRTKRIPPAR